MRILTILAASATVAASLLAFEPGALAQAYLPAPPPPPAVFVEHGQRYCFAPDGWHGPGWYWCGYAHRVGFGWGGPVGWHGWGAPWLHGGGPGWFRATPGGGWRRPAGPQGWPPHRHPGPHRSHGRGGHPHHHHGGRHHR